MNSGIKKLSFIFCLFLFLASYGCAPQTYRVNPGFDTLSKNIRTAGLIPPDIKIYELNAGGVQELRDDWCDTGRDNVTKAVQQYFKDRGIGLKVLKSNKELENEIDDVQALYRAVSYSIYEHTYTGNTFRDKVRNFDYTLGPLKKLTGAYGVDALLFVYGMDEISTGGRKALRVVGAITGVQPRSGVTVIEAALVDKNGSVLWFNFEGGEGSFDLRKFDSAEKIVFWTLKPLNGYLK